MQSAELKLFVVVSVMTQHGMCGAKLRESWQRWQVQRRWKVRGERRGSVQCAAAAAACRIPSTAGKVIRLNSPNMDSELTLEIFSEQN